MSSPAEAGRILATRVSAELAASVHVHAELAGISRSAYIRHLIAHSGPPRAAIDAQGVAELRRIGQMLRNFLRTPPATWTPEQTAAFHAALQRVDEAAHRLTKP